MNLRFVARDGDAIILESDQGERFQVLIDESMRDALKNNPRVSGADFSPKLVQDLIRAGLSIEEVAAEVGQEVNAISPFAAPILDELRYVLDAALETEVSDGVSMMRFQDLSFIHIPVFTTLLSISYAVFCLKKKKFPIYSPLPSIPTPFSIPPILSFSSTSYHLTPFPHYSILLYRAASSTPLHSP